MDRHATAGTFAFRRKLLQQSHYEDDAVLAEEKFFEKLYHSICTIDPFHTILVFSHEQNTFDKRRLINKDNSLCKETAVNVNKLSHHPHNLGFTQLK